MEDKKRYVERNGNRSAGSGKHKVLAKKGREEENYRQGQVREGRGVAEGKAMHTWPALLSR